MYTILINDDNTLTKSMSERIMHRSHNVNTFQFLMNPTYVARNGELMDMSGFIVTLEYVLPISRTYKTMILSPKTELYKDRLQYIVPVTTDFTSEPGELEIKLTMTKVDMLEDGSTVEYVRQTNCTHIHVIAVENWSDYVANADLSTLAEVMLTIQAKQEELKALAEQLHIDKVADIKLDIDNDSVHLIDNNGNKIGVGINTTELGDEIVESADEGLIEVITI